MVKEVICNSCGRSGGEEFGTADATHRCPRCGSSDVKVHITLQEQVTVHEQLRLKARHQDEKKPFREAIFGDDLRERDGRWMHKEQVVDREAGWYDKVVVDPETGEVVRECHEPLSQHRDCGSAKMKRPRKTVEKPGGTQG